MPTLIEAPNAVDRLLPSEAEVAFEATERAVAIGGLGGLRNRLQGDNVTPPSSADTTEYTGTYDFQANGGKGEGEGEGEDDRGQDRDSKSNREPNIDLTPDRGPYRRNGDEPEN